MKEKKDFSNSKFNKRVRISEENLEWLKKNKKKGAISVFLENIIDKFKKDYGNTGFCPDEGIEK